MVGQGRPIALKLPIYRFAKAQIRPGSSRLLLTALLLALIAPATTARCSAAEKTVRLRLAWGSGTAAKQRWSGTIAVEGGLLTQLQPLGIESDAAVAMRIDGSRLIVNPLVKRGFDGCDIMVQADEHALVRVELRSDQQLQQTVFEAPLSEVLATQLQRPLDDSGSYFLARRSPGDVLRVLPTREHYVFSPGETWELKLQPDLEAALAHGPVVLELRLRRTGVEKSSWQASRQLTNVGQLAEGVSFEMTCPPTEGAYHLCIEARPHENLATRFVPGQQARAIARREIDFVVIDPDAQLTPLADHWLPVLTIDPANPSWWQRLPAWAQVPRLPGLKPGAVGNIRPVVRPTPTGALMELPPAPASGDPYWQSYPLPVREPGQPHLVEIEYPVGVEQSLDIVLVEPDAAGKVATAEQTGSIHSVGSRNADSGEIGVHRFVIWPQTRAPQLLIVNRQCNAPGQYGKIKLLRQDSTRAIQPEPAIDAPSMRMVAGYIANPYFAEGFGASQTLDTESGLSVQSWSTFLAGTRRLAQALRYRGHNAVMLSVAADGSSLYPSQLLQPSPRYDTGLLAANGQDPVRKDVLEMILRIFDREGLRIVPTLQLATPLPRLEVLRQAGDPGETGIACVDHRGQTLWAQDPDESALVPRYNPLNQRVQSEIAEVVRELTSRYAHHYAFAGVGLQLSGEGYGLMPGLVSGLDDHTMASFYQATNLQQPIITGDRFLQRANLLLRDHRDQWKRWRQDGVTQLYHRLADQVASARGDLRLSLVTDELLSGTELRRRVRRSIDDPAQFREILPDHAVDLAQIAAHPAIDTLLPHSLSAADSVQQQAIQLRVNAASAHAELLPSEQSVANLFVRGTEQFRLASFDAQSPFGAKQTSLTIKSRYRRTGHADRFQMIKTFAAADSTLIVEGGDTLNFSEDPYEREILHAVRQLPTNAEVREQRVQPVTLRVYRAENATFVVLINESPWQAGTQVQLVPSQASDYRKLGSVHFESAALGTDSQSWNVELQPYDLQAWKFDDPRLRVGNLAVSVDDVAKADLKQRVRELESRAGNLSIQRPYSQLQNPGFELQDGGVRIVGWQPRQGALGSISIDRANRHSGNLSLRLKSEDLTGVAAQSHLFPVPQTGQLTVSAFVNVRHFGADAQLRIAVQDQFDGREYQQYAILGNSQLRDDGWTRIELPLNDVPIDEDMELRLQFHLTGDAEVLVDDVELLDLRFDDARRRTLVTRIHGANKALEKGQVIDCLRVVDDYWYRYLLEHVPPTEAVEAVATKPATTVEPTPEATEPQEEKGFGSRVRGWVPKLWR